MSILDQYGKRKRNKELAVDDPKDTPPKFLMPGRTTDVPVLNTRADEYAEVAAKAARHVYGLESERDEARAEIHRLRDVHRNELTKMQEEFLTRVARLEGELAASKATCETLRADLERIVTQKDYYQDRNREVNTKLDVVGKVVIDLMHAARGESRATSKIAAEAEAAVEEALTLSSLRDPDQERTS